MKFRLFSLLLFVIVIDASQNYAQTVYSPSLDLYVNQDTGGLWHSRSASQMDSAINNQMMQQIESGRIMLVNAIAERAAKEIDGAAKIRAGRATTKFVPSPQNSIIERMVESAGTPPEKQAVRESVNIALTTFNNILKAKRLAPFDTSNGNALAFVLCYLIYNGEDPGDARLRKMSSSMREVSMKDTVYQGTPDAEKQPQYESKAYRTMMAVRAYEASLRADTSAQEKQQAKQTARSYAASVMNELLLDGRAERIQLSDTSNWGFEDKGERIAKSGIGATTTFSRTEESSWAQKNAYCYQSGRRIEGDISCFYDLRKRFDEEVRTLAGQTNDLAYANAVAFKLAYECYTQGKVKLNTGQFRWILSEMQKDIKGSSTFQGLSDISRQETSDSLVFQTMNAYDEYQRAVSDLEGGNGLLAESRFRNARSDGLKLVTNIFSPRDINNYELRANGFTKVR